MTLVFKPYIAVEVYEDDGVTLIAELPRRWDISGSEPLNVPGVGQITISLDDPVLARHPGILSLGNWVKFYIGDGLGHGDYCTAFQIRQRKTRFRGSNEAADRLRTVSGPTPLALLDDFMVKHETQPPRQDASENRSYTWTAPPGEWYDASQWSDTLDSAGEWLDHITNARSGTVAKPLHKPVNWPAKHADWIRIIGGGEWQFFRTSYTIPSGGKLVKMYLTADEICRGFLDGDMVISRDETENGYESFGTYKTFLPAGTHYFSVLMRSKATPGGDGVDAFLFALCSLKTNGKVDQVLRTSSTGGAWVGHGGLPAPGWRQAEILRSQVFEAQARGNESANMLTVDFTKNVDSTGASWTTEVSRSMRIGTSILDSQAQLSELGNFDVWVKPHDFKLQAFIRKGADMSNSVTYEPGRNLLDWDVDENDRVKNTALVKYDGGWVEYSAPTSITNFGHREVLISLNSAADDETAAAIAGAHIERRKHARKRAGAAPEIDKNQDDQPTASVVLSPGAVPGIDYRAGTRLKVPSGTGVHAVQRIIGLTWAEDNETGLITIDPEFAEEE